MRGIDWQLAVFTAKYWMTGDDSDLELCLLLQEPDRFLSYLNEINLKPGVNIPLCPQCGDEHRWPLIRDLLKYMRYLDTERHSELLDYIYARYGEYVGTKFPPWFPDKSILTQVVVRKPKLPPEPTNMTPEKQAQWDALMAKITEKFYRDLEGGPGSNDLDSLPAKRKPLQS